MLTHLSLQLVNRVAEAINSAKMLSDLPQTFKFAWPNTCCIDQGLTNAGLEASHRIGG